MSPCRANQREIWANGATAVSSYVLLRCVRKLVPIAHRSGAVLCLVLLPARKRLLPVSPSPFSGYCGNLAYRSSILVSRLGLVV
jgi:hypothetical protein